MPEISRFFGIVIQMYWDDHAPPHFHARYGEHEALINIRTLEILRGSLPGRAMGLTLEWAAMHRAALAANWVRCAKTLPPMTIPPLE